MTAPSARPSILATRQANSTRASRECPHARIIGLRTFSTLVASSDSARNPCLTFSPPKKSKLLPKAKVNAHPEMKCDVLVIGAGPTGLACAIEAQKVGLKVIVVDKGCLVNSLFHYPANMAFLHHAGAAGDRRYSLHHGAAKANPRRSARVLPQSFRALPPRRPPVRMGQDCHGRGRKLQHHRDRPRRASARLPHEKSYRLDGLLRPGQPASTFLARTCPRFRTTMASRILTTTSDVLVIGGKNSAAIAALDLWRHGARVTLVHRGAQIHHHVKYWIKPDIENRIKNGRDRSLLQ